MKLSEDLSQCNVITSNVSLIVMFVLGYISVYLYLRITNAKGKGNEIDPDFNEDNIKECEKFFSEG